MKAIDITSKFEPDDIKSNRMIALFAYPLFFLPLLMAPKSKYCKFYANQSLVLNLALVVWVLALIASCFIVTLSPDTWLWLSMFLLIVIGCCLILILYMIIQTILDIFDSKAREYPVISKIKIINY